MKVKTLVILFYDLEKVMYKKGGFTNVCEKVFNRIGRKVIVK